MTGKTSLKTAFAAIAANDKALRIEARAAAEAYQDAMTKLAERAGYGVIHESATLNVLHSARQSAEGTLAAIDTVEREYPTQEASG
jgi:hypothetical protein